MFSITLTSVPSLQKPPLQNMKILFINSKHRSYHLHTHQAVDLYKCDSQLLCIEFADNFFDIYCLKSIGFYNEQKLKPSFNNNNNNNAQLFVYYLRKTQLLSIIITVMLRSSIFNVMGRRLALKSVTSGQNLSVLRLFY